MDLPQDANIFQRSLNTVTVAYNRTVRPQRKAIAESLFPSQTGFWAFLLGVGLAVAILMVWLDADVIQWMRAYFPHGSAVSDVFSKITHFGTSGWILMITGLIGVALSLTRWSQLPRQKRVRRIALYGDVNFIFFTVALSGIAANLIKNTIGRARPRLLDDMGAHHFDFAAFESVFASFPSGHATTSGSLCMTLVLLLPRWAALWLLLALLGGASRVVVDAHYPSDVIAGLSFGAVFVLIAARWLAQRGTMFVFNKSWVPHRKRI
jgi:membrane-associated phospholipid phosphatase